MAEDNNGATTVSKPAPNTVSLGDKDQLMDPSPIPPKTPILVEPQDTVSNEHTTDVSEKSDESVAGPSQQRPRFSTKTTTAAESTHLQLDIVNREEVHGVSPKQPMASVAEEHDGSPMLPTPDAFGPPLRSSQLRPKTVARSSFRKTSSRQASSGKTIIDDRQPPTDRETSRTSLETGLKPEVPNPAPKIVLRTRVLHPPQPTTNDFVPTVDIVVVYLFQNKKDDTDLGIFQCDITPVSQVSNPDGQKSNVFSGKVKSLATRSSAAAPKPDSESDNTPTEPKSQKDGAALRTASTKHSTAHSQIPPVTGSLTVPKKLPLPPKDERVNWLCHPEYLPREIPGARIITIGIDISNALDEAFNLEDAAAIVLKELSIKRTPKIIRPLIFIGHALGGFVIEQLLITAAKTADEEWGQILRSTAGLLLFSCPIGGCDKSKTLLAKLYDLKVTSNFFSAFNSNSPELKSLHQKFDKSVLLLGVSREKRTRMKTGKNQPIPRDSGFPVYHFLSKREHSDKVDMKEMLKSIPSLAVRPIEDPEAVLSLPQGYRTMVKFLRPTDEDVLRLIFEIMIKMVQARRLFDTSAFGTPEDMESLLRETHVKAKMKDSRGRTILHIAAQHKRSDILTCLLNSVYNENPSPRDDELDTPLHYAVRRNDQNSVDALVEKGADVNFENRYHDTPISLSMTKRISKKLRQNPFKLIKGETFGIRKVPKATSSSFFHSNKDAVKARENFQITMTEVYNLNNSDPDYHWRLTLSVNEFIYGPKEIVDIYTPLRPVELRGTDPLCTWFHISENNMTWVTNLFARLGYSGELFAGRGHTSDLPYGRAITPHVALPPILDDEDREGRDAAVLAIFVPYVSYDVNIYQKQMNEFITKVTEKKTSDDIRSSLKRRVDDMRSRWFKIGDFISSTSRYSTSAQSESGNVPSDAGKHELESDAGCETERDYDARSEITDEPTGPYDFDSDDKALIEAYLYGPSALHVRRTLDQYYYHMLSSTDKRDVDQVVSRWAMRQEKSKSIPPHNILMIDQLWLWRFTASRNGKRVEYVISSFPDRSGVDIDPTAYDDNLRQTVLEPRDGRQPIRSSNDLVFRILGACANLFDRCQNVESLQFLQIFENSIGKVSDKESVLFKRFQNRSEKLHRLSDKFKKYDEKRKILLNKLLDIREETKLLVEIKDILDEINIMLNVLETQSKLLQDEKLNRYKENGPVDGSSHFDDTERIVGHNIIDFMRMKDQAREVQASLETLMDLKQKAANAWEAKAAREGAEETARQGSIMVVFTAVTIIFLPLSFMASFFALDISSFPQDPRTGQTNWPLGRICAYIFGISGALIVPLLIMAANVLWLTRRIERWRKVSFPTLVLHCLRLVHDHGIRQLRAKIRDRFNHFKEHRDEYARVQYDEEEVLDSEAERDVCDKFTEHGSLGPELADFSELDIWNWSNDVASYYKWGSEDDSDIDIRKGSRLAKTYRRWRRKRRARAEDDNVSDVTEV